MPRRPRGIQLGRTTPTGLLRAADGLLGAALLFAGWSAFLFWEARAGVPTDPVEAPVAGEAGLRPAAELPLGPSRQAAALLLSGTLEAPRLVSALTLVVEAAPAGFRITRVEVRPEGDPGIVEATVSAEVNADAAVAGFLSALSRHEAVLSAGVITETHRPNRATAVGITATITASPRGLEEAGK